MNKRIKQEILRNSDSNSPLIYKVRTNKTNLVKGSVIQVTEVTGNKAVVNNFLFGNPTPRIVVLTTLELSQITK